MPALSKTTTGSVLFWLDATLVLLIWPSVLWLAALPLDGPMLALSGAVYAAFNLLLLFAMGLYRRDAILNASRSIARIPLVVGMGAAPSVTILYLLPMLSGVPALSRAHQAVVFAMAVVTFTACAFAARALLRLLLRGHVLRRRLLIVGAGGRAWDLLLMLSREGRSLHDDVTLLHNPVFGPVDPRLLDERPQQILRPEGFDVLRIAHEVNADIVIVAPDERYWPVRARAIRSPTTSVSSSARSAASTSSAWN
jgi:hypothetical protein